MLASDAGRARAAAARRRRARGRRLRARPTTRARCVAAEPGALRRRSTRTAASRAAPRRARARPPRRCCSSSTPTRCRRPAASTRSARRPRTGARGRRSCCCPGGERVNTRGGVVHFLGFGWAGGHDEPVATRRPTSRSRSASPPARRWRCGAARGTRSAASTRRSSCTARTSTSRCGCGWPAGASGIVPAARVEHDYEFDKGDYKWFHLERNRWWIVLGDLPGARCSRCSRRRCCCRSWRCCAVAGRGGWLRAKLRAQLAVLRTLPMALRRRRAIQARRRDRARASWRG